MYDGDSFCRSCGSRRTEPVKSAPESIIFGIDRATESEPSPLADTYDTPRTETPLVSPSHHEHEPVSGQLSNDIQKTGFDETIETPYEDRQEFIHNLSDNAQDMVQSAKLNGSFQESDQTDQEPSVNYDVASLNEEDQTGVQETPAASKTVAAYSYVPNNSAANPDLPVGFSGKAADSEKVFFGKTAFIICLALIGALSIACGVLIGVVSSLI
jgi:hypothetical protein